MIKQDSRNSSSASRAATGFASAILLALVLPAGPAQAGVEIIAIELPGPDNESCQTTTGLNCYFACGVGSTIHVSLSGAGGASASCGGASTSCTAPNGISTYCSASSDSEATTASGGSCGFNIVNVMGVRARAGAGLVRCWAD